ncbi:MAG TPA: hypothetical protein VMZ53_08265 [Kofleriaceae bacterium]|nr:hypothetical protein [Kofleriaceae bacterium]
MRALVALVLVACGSHASHSTLKGSSEPARAAPTTPAPAISFIDDRFEVRGLPAIARDRSIVVVPVIEGDGGRGYPNLALEVRLNNDKPIETLPVMISNDYEALVANGSAMPELVRRIEKTNARLREIHGKDDLVEMKRSDNLDGRVSYANGTLTLVLDAGRSLASEHPDWKAPQLLRRTNAPPCENPEYLKAVYFAEGINAIVVEIAFEGTDTCWEPGNQLHVVTW